MTLNRAKNLRRLSLFAAILALALMFFSKNFVLVASAPSPTKGDYALRITDNFISLYRISDTYWPPQATTGTPESLTRFQIQRRRTYFDPAHINKRYQLESYPHYNIPLWLPLALTALPIAFYSWRIRAKAKHNNCAECNYNLKKNTSGKCSECGTQIAATTD